MKRSLVLLNCLLILCTGLNLRGQNINSEYSIVNKFHLPGNGSWDYLTVDESGARLFISHSTIVQVVDLKTGQLAVTNAVVGTIALEGKPEFPASDGNGKVYVNIEDKSLISVIDVKTLKVEKS